MKSVKKISPTLKQLKDLRLSLADIGKFADLDIFSLRYRVLNKSLSEKERADIAAGIATYCETLRDFAEGLTRR